MKDAAWAKNPPVKLLLGLGTYLAVLIAWVFFRASDFSVAMRLLGGMFGAHGQGEALLSPREILQVGIVTAGMLIAQWSLRDTSIEAAVARRPRSVVTCGWALMAGAIILTQGSSNAFIYFQF